jgi:hypothetical protein
MREVPVEAERPRDVMASHQGERHAVGEADLLVAELAEQLERIELDLGIGAQDYEGLGGQQRLGAVGGEVMPRPASQQGERLVEHEVAGVDAPRAFGSCAQAFCAAA